MKILGIDPGSLVTGYGVIEANGREVKLLEAGSIKPRAKDPLQERIHKIYQHLDDIITSYQPSVLVLEKLYTHHGHITTAAILGHARGVICLLAAERKLQFEESSVKRIRKALTGNGAATKKQVQSMVANVFGINPEKLTTDASDALALALGYAQLNQKNL